MLNITLFIFFLQIDAFLISYTAFYQKSPKRVRELSHMVEQDEHILKPTRADGTRWVDCKWSSQSTGEKSYTELCLSRSLFSTETGSEQWIFYRHKDRNDAAKNYALEMLKKMSRHTTSSCT